MILQISGRGKLIRVLRRRLWLTRHDGNMPFINVIPVMNRILEEQLNVRTKKRVNLPPKIVCVWVARRKLKPIAKIRRNTEAIWFGSVGIVAGLPTMFVMELYIFVHHVMIGTVNECDNGNKWDTQLPRGPLPSNPSLVQESLVRITNHLVRPVIRMVLHLSQSKFSTVLVVSPVELEVRRVKNYQVRPTCYSIQAVRMVYKDGNNSVEA
jgi:hypothetical protein